MENKNYKTALIFMLLHASLVIVWNIVGVWLLSQDESALGPTASLVGALVFATLIAIYLFFYKKGYEKLFLSIVSIGALLGATAIYGAFTKDPVLWPSEFWRYAGVAINTLGISGFIIALRGHYKSKY